MAVTAHVHHSRLIDGRRQTTWSTATVQWTTLEEPMEGPPVTGHCEYLEGIDPLPDDLLAALAAGKPLSRRDQRRLARELDRRKQAVRAAREAHNRSMPPGMTIEPEAPWGVY